MKEKLLFISGIIGSFSATIILLINYALTFIGVDTSGYTQIINVVGIGLAIVILIVSIIFLNRYDKIQTKNTIAQSTNALNILSTQS